MLTVLNQVLRTLLHSRLQLGIRQYQDDPHFQGDIILLEPGETDLTFFKMAPLHHHFELLGWSETQVMQRFVLVGMVASLIGISLALTLRDSQRAQMAAPAQPAGVEQVVHDIPGR